METIKIPVYVSKEAAAREGKREFGETQYGPSEGEWASITADERAYLAGGSYQDPWPTSYCTSNKLSIPTGSATWEGVVAGMRASMARKAQIKAKEEETKAQDAATNERRVQEALALPATEWISSDPFGKPCYRTFFGVDTDPRIVARREAEIAPLLAERAARLKEAEAAREKAEEDMKAKLAADKEAAVESFKAYATSRGGALARAVAEGYDVTRGVVDDVLKQIVEALGPLGQSAIVLRQGSRAYDKTNWNDRKSPDEHAFAVLDKVAAAVEQVKSPDAMEVSVLKIQRVDYDDGAGNEEAFTAALVELDALIMPHIVVIVRADSSSQS